MLKILDKLITRSFVGPSLLSFFVALFVLVMQFLWKYIDEILGKGFTIFDLIELIFYFSVTLIPMALPITILISSVLVYGDMAEKYEISSFKSAGVSMIRLLLPGLFIAFSVATFSFLSSNLLKPNANFQFQKRLTQLRNQKTALAFEEGIFNNSFNDMLIRINDIDPNGKKITDVIIFDHTGSDKSKVNIIKSKEGSMYTGNEGKYFVMELDSGMQYLELENKSGSKSQYPFLRTEFVKWTKVFDMSQFDLDDGFTQFNRKREELLNSIQLMSSIDSFNQEIAKFQDNLYSEMRKSTDAVQLGDKSGPPDTLQRFSQTKPTTNAKVNTDPRIEAQNISKVQLNKKDFLAHNSGVKNLHQDTLHEKNHIINQIRPYDGNAMLETVPDALKLEIINRAISNLSSHKERWVGFGLNIKDYKSVKEKYKLHLHQHFSWAVICIIFLLIGAPMGAIIRKGGYGYPFLVAVLFYMIFIISTIFGTKLVRSNSMDGALAAWIPCIIQAPFGILLTFLALRDIKLQSLFTSLPGISALQNFIGKLKTIKRQSP